MKRIAVGLIAAGLLAVSSATLAVDGGSGAAGTSAHNATSAKGTCAKCHIPHGGKGDKIWAQVITSVASFSGVHQLCNSCHFTGNILGATSGITAPANNVFVLGRYQNHSMLSWANINNPAVSMPASFPLNTADTDTIWTVTDPDVGGGNNFGVYCGTCHNPHKQPMLPTAITDGNGDYLRNVATITTLAAFGGSGARNGACTQCHVMAFQGSNSVGHEGNCMICHSPHRGQTVATPTSATLAEKILVISLVGNTFTATPNVPGFTSVYASGIAAVCYGCHKATVAGGGGLPIGSTALITSINEHHPMGTGVTFGATGHAPGYAGNEGAGNFTCSSCHDWHDATQDYYLRSSSGTYNGIATDDGGYCAGCHTSQQVGNLGSLGDAHRHDANYWSGSRASCFMCHFIHDGGEPNGRGAVARADITALMRVPPVNFAAAVQNADSDVNDYEDMCYGCHSNATITKGTGTAGSTLSENGATSFTHNFTGTPSTDVGTRMTANGYPVASATPTGGGDYGAVVGNLYCGSCHNVHAQNIVDEQGQMFRNFNKFEAIQSEMCVDCHSVAGMTTGRSHPTYRDAGYNTSIPNARTVGAIPPMFGTGGDGVQGGRTGNSVPGSGPATGQMSCETCHNFHASSTSRSGNIVEAGVPVAANRGKLLVMDNMSTATGSDMCQACHGGAY